jgi:hypothetical protein
MIMILIIIKNDNNNNENDIMMVIIKMKMAIKFDIHLFTDPILVSSSFGLIPSNTAGITATGAVTAPTSDTTGNTAAGTCFSFYLYVGTTRLFLPKITLSAIGPLCNPITPIFVTYTNGTSLYLQYCFESYVSQAMLGYSIQSSGAC